MPVCRSGKPQHNGTGAGTSDWPSATTNRAMNSSVCTRMCVRARGNKTKKHFTVNQLKNTQNMLICPS